MKKECIHLEKFHPFTHPFSEWINQSINNSFNHSVTIPFIVLDSPVLGIGQKAHPRYETLLALYRERQEPLGKI